MTTPLHNNAQKLELINKVQFNKFFKANNWETYNKLFFDNLAPKYDATNQLHSFGTKAAINRAFVSHIPIQPNARILDVATGSGDIAILLAQQCPDASITAIDVSEAMLNVARAKAQKAGVQNITFETADALNLPYANNSFDVVTISFALRNLLNLEDGLKEMIRVTANGGYVTSIDQGKPANLLFKMLYKAYFYNIAPLIGKLVFHRNEFNSFRYLPESNNYFPNQDKLVKIFEHCGLTNVRNYNLWLGAVAQQIGKVVK